MIVRNSGKRHAFTVIDRTAFEDENLSLEAKGVYGYCIVKPDNWHISMNDIQKRCKVGRDKLQRIFAELRDNGYAELLNRRDQSGKVSGREWIIYESPSLNEHRKPENTVVGTESLKTPTSVKTDSGEIRRYNKHEIVVNTKKEEINTKGEGAKKNRTATPEKVQQPDPPRNQGIIDPLDPEAFREAIKTHSGGVVYQRLRQTAKAKNLDLGTVVEKCRLYLCEQIARFQATGTGISLENCTPLFITSRVQRWLMDEGAYNTTQPPRPAMRRIS